MVVVGFAVYVAGYRGWEHLGLLHSLNNYAQVSAVALWHFSGDCNFTFSFSMLKGVSLDQQKFSSDWHLTLCFCPLRNCRLFAWISITLPCICHVPKDFNFLTIFLLCLSNFDNSFVTDFQQSLLSAWLLPSWLFNLAFIFFKLNNPSLYHIFIIIYSSYIIL